MPACESTAGVHRHTASDVVEAAPARVPSLAPHVQTVPGPDYSK
jgi:hypothetical protein